MLLQAFVLSPKGDEDGETSCLHDSGGSGYRMLVEGEEENACSLIDLSDPGPE